MDLTVILDLVRKYFFILVLPILISIGTLVGVYFSVRIALSKSNRAIEFKKSIMIIIRGPVSVALIGTALIIIEKEQPKLFLPYLQPGYVTFIVELVFLLASINAARKISTLLVKELLKLGDAGRRFLLLGIYSIGLVALFYIIFTSPVNTSLTQNAFQIVGFITGIVITYLVVYLINLILIRYQSAVKDNKPQLHTTIAFGRRVIVGAIGLLGVAAAGFAAFPQASGAIASLFVAAGFTSIVIGLAAQSSLSNLIAGGVISFAQPFQINDAIIFDNNYCFVEDIRLVFTVLRTWDGRRLMVPNNQFLSTTIVNYNAVDTTKLAVIYIQITLESDVEKAMDIMKDVIAGHPLFFPAEGLPSVLIMEYNEFGIQLRALGRAKDQNDNWYLEKESLLNIKKEFERNGIKIAVPRRDVFLHGNNGNDAGLEGKGPNRSS